jgi:hypothetical protein
VASKSAYQAQEKGAEIEEALDAFEKLLERLRAIYEQYFLGIAKVAPSQLHTEAERRQRDLTQIQIKNTALRYRYATLSQKFGAYNTYWKRTMRMIEQGRYVRDLQRVQRRSEHSGEAIPEEILAAMPKMMRERVKRDRANVEKLAAMQGKLGTGTQDQTIDEAMDLTGDATLDEEMVAEAPRRAERPAPGHIHRLDEALPDDINLDEMFATLTREAEAALDESPAMVRSKPHRPTVPPPAVVHDFDPPTERAAMPPTMEEAPRRRSGPTTPPLRPPPMRSSSPSIRVPTPVPTPAPEPPKPAAPAPVAATSRSTPPAGSAVPRPGLGAPSSGVRAAASARPGVSDRPSALGPPPGMSESETRTLYNRYLKARELCGESNDGVTYDKLLRTLRSQSSRIMTDHRARGVEFGVVIKDNKVVLKAKPKI